MIQGSCDPAFAAIRDAFASNFSEREELGASVCVIHSGTVVVDLWAGYADPERRRPWTDDTVVVVFSCTKAATAMCAHVLAAQGDLDLDAPVARYWPAFAHGGRNTITTRMLLSHQAGLPGLQRAFPADLVYDFDAMVGLLEQERPLWPPGSRHGYHTLTFGWLIGEVVRRVSGQNLGRFFDDQLAQPLNLDFWIGLPKQHESRVATSVMFGSGATEPAFDLAYGRGEPIQVAVVQSVGNFLEPGACDTPEAHAAEIPAANGITNGRGLARMYAPFASIDMDLDDDPFLPRDQVVQMIATESAGLDAVGLVPSRYSAGFEKAAPGRSVLIGTSQRLILSERAFGHGGLGGSLGFADPGARVSFGYTPNRHQRPDEHENARAQALVDATYRSLGYRSYAGGKWV